ncbi:flagellin [Hyphomonas sp. UBA4494]|jgi:flagellar hook-associated protein 3 FlgL|uniref:flagellin n=1 Tax=Hyphomonas sp. UBA4494 TaxID=1946631 RepID=UPI0025B813E6|nr:flagellin [Hyphomonas sp. UBA4494]
MDRFSISSGLMTASLGQHISELRTQIGKTSTEATTGRYEDLTLHLSGRIGKAMLGQKALADISTDREVLNLRASRLSLIQTSLGTVQESSSGIAANMLSAIGGEHETDVGIAARDAKAALSASLSSLNARYGDRFLFAGDATSTLPFSDQSALLADIELIADSATDSADFATQLDDYFTSPTGGWLQNIYQGSTTASDPESVTADNDAIKSLIRDLTVLAISGPDGPLASLDGYKTLVQETSLSLSSSETQITNLRADLGVYEERNAIEQKTLDTEETLLTASFNDLTARDQYEAATELQSLQTTLEASYLITARLSQLSLLNYLG